MTTYAAALPPTITPTADTPQALAEWLATRGVAVTSVALRGDPPNVVVLVDADRDPSADLLAYDNTPSAERRRIKQLTKTALDYAVAVEAGQTPTAAQTVAAVRATIRLLQATYQDMSA